MSTVDITPPPDLRPIPGFFGYFAEAAGFVWSRLNPHPGFPGRWRRLRATRDKDGYPRVILCRDRRRFNRLVHRLVLEAFVGACPVGMEACHDDGNPGNARLDNLRWDTRANNHADKHRHGTSIAGERNLEAKLTAADVLEIRRLAADGTAARRILASYPIRDTQLRRIIAGQSWKHLPRAMRTSDERCPKRPPKD